MSRGWRSRGTASGDGAPVELRFVDMFMAAIGALIFMTVTLALVMQHLTAKATMQNANPAQMRVFATMEPTDGNPKTTNNLWGKFDFEFDLVVESGTNKTFRTFKVENSGAANTIDPPFLFLGNSLNQTSPEAPFGLLIVDAPRKGQRYDFTFRGIKTPPGFPLKPSENSNLWAAIHIMWRESEIGRAHV